MNKKFEEFIDETKQKLLAYEMDESCFDDYDDEDRQKMRRLREALYPSKQQVYSFKDSKVWQECNKPRISMDGGKR